MATHVNDDTIRMTTLGSTTTRSTTTRNFSLESGNVVPLGRIVFDFCQWSSLHIRDMVTWLFEQARSAPPAAALICCCPLWWYHYWVWITIGSYYKNESTVTNETMVTITTTMSPSTPTTSPEDAGNMQCWIEIFVRSVTTILAFSLFVLALSLYDFCKQHQEYQLEYQNYNYHQYQQGQQRPFHHHHQQQHYPSSTNDEKFYSAADYKKKLRPTTMTVKAGNLRFVMQPQQVQPSSLSSSPSPSPSPPPSSSITHDITSKVQQEVNNKRGLLSFALVPTHGRNSLGQLPLDKDRNQEEEDEEENDKAVESISKNNNNDKNPNDAPFFAHDDDNEETELLLCLPTLGNEHEQHCVSAFCVICLSTYQVGDEVSWSPTRVCAAVHKTDATSATSVKSDVTAVATLDTTREQTISTGETSSTLIVAESPSTASSSSSSSSSPSVPNHFQLPLRQRGMARNCCTHTFHTNCLVQYAEMMPQQKQAPPSTTRHHHQEQDQHTSQQPFSLNHALTSSSSPSPSLSHTASMWHSTTLRATVARDSKTILNDDDDDDLFIRCPLCRGPFIGRERHAV